MSNAYVEVTVRVRMKPSQLDQARVRAERYADYIAEYIRDEGMEDLITVLDLSGLDDITDIRARTAA